MVKQEKQYTSIGVCYCAYARRVKIIYSPSILRDGGKGTRGTDIQKGLTRRDIEKNFLRAIGHK